MVFPFGHGGNLRFGIFSAAMPQRLPRMPFQNGGSYCYSNTALQLLATNQDFVNTILSHTCDARCFLCDLRDDLRVECRVLPGSPIPLLKRRCANLETPGAPRWFAGGQQDVSEFLQAVTRAIDRCALSRNSEEGGEGGRGEEYEGGRRRTA